MSNVKLTEEQVLKIFHDDRICVEIAEEYGISDVNVSSIKIGKKWGWLTGKEYKKSNKKFLNQKEIYEIIEKRKNGVLVKDLAKQYGYSKSTIQDNIKKYSNSIVI